MRSASQRMLEMSGTRDGISTRELAEAIWPDRFRVDQGRLRAQDLQHLLAMARNAMIVHEKHGRVRQAGHAPGAYNNVKSIVWKITPEGRAWLRENEPQRVEERRAATRATAEERAAKKLHQEALLETVRAQYGPGTPPSVRRPLSYQLRAAGCSLQSIADIFNVTRELIRLDYLEENQARTQGPGLLLETAS